MRITFDPAKGAWTLEHRGLDFLDAQSVLEGLNFTVEDVRRDYGEVRWITLGPLRGRMVVIVWTPRLSGDEHVVHVISMRKANEREKARFENQLGKG
jgi:uncharacterized DUF497 family protein